jgi:hypothetical protein
MRSPTIDSWQAEKLAQTLVTILTARFGALPEEVTATIGSTRDLDTLDRWAPLVGSSSSLEQFRKDAKL